LPVNHPEFSGDGRSIFLPTGRKQQLEHHAVYTEAQTRAQTHVDRARRDNFLGCADDVLAYLLAELIAAPVFEIAAHIRGTLVGTHTYGFGNADNYRLRVKLLCS
jgi:hypothetical protein